MTDRACWRDLKLVMTRERDLVLQLSCRRAVEALTEREQFCEKWCGRRQGRPLRLWTWYVFCRRGYVSYPTYQTKVRQTQVVKRAQ